MKISEKIAQIRQQPEHIRLRYVWGSVTISMLIILAIWVFSIGSLFQGEKSLPGQETPNTPSITEQLQTLKQQAPSIKDLTAQTTDPTNEGIANTKNTTDFQYPVTADDTTTPQASAYSDLPTATPAQ